MNDFLHRQILFWSRICFFDYIFLKFLNCPAFLDVFTVELFVVSQCWKYVLFSSPSSQARKPYICISIFIILIYLVFTVRFLVCWSIDPTQNIICYCERQKIKLFLWKNSFIYNNRWQILSSVNCNSTGFTLEIWGSNPKLVVVYENWNKYV